MTRVTGVGITDAPDRNRGRKHRLCVLLVASALGVGTLLPTLAQQAAPPVENDPIRPEEPAHRGYLSDSLPNMDTAIGQPPAVGSAALAADLAAFWGTRALLGSPRWVLATKDVHGGAKDMLNHFACTLGYRLDPTAVPKLVTLFDRVRIDVGRAAGIPKGDYHRIRPHVGNEAPLCVEREPDLDRSFSYPSGHATLGWTVALILTSLVPDRATDILTRGRIYGESRVICGVHWRSDVEAGRTIAASLYAVLEGDPAFRADMDAVRAELKQALVASETKPDGGTCKVEAAAATTPPP